LYFYEPVRLHNVDSKPPQALLDPRARDGVALFQLAVESGFHTNALAPGNSRS
jgi:hypothetical protein